MDRNSHLPPITVPRIHFPAAEGDRFAVRVSGGNTQVEVEWETLRQAAAHVASAQDIGQLQLDDIAANNTVMMTSGAAAPHWRAPLLGIRSVALAVRMSMVSSLVRICLDGLDSAHEAYRDVESLVRRWLQLSDLLSESSYVITQGLDGDSRLVQDWSRSVAVLGGRELMRVLAEYFTRGRAGDIGRRGSEGPEDRASSTGFLAIEALRGQDDLIRFEMRANSLELGDQTRTSVHEGDGTLHSWYRQMGDAAEHGDIAVTSVTGDDGSTRYMVHLPGLDMDITELNRHDGRGYLGLVDSIYNDADQLTDVVEEALAASGAQEGDTIALSGYSLGGIGVSNLVRNGRLGEKYDVHAATSIGAPGRNATFPPGTETSTTHIQDRRDPVPHLLGEHQGTGTNRQVIDVAHHSETEGSAPLVSFGDAHTYEHYLEIVEELEADPDAHLGEDGDALLRDFAELYEGEAETRIFETGWTEDSEAWTTDSLLEEALEISGLNGMVRDAVERLDVVGIGDAFGPETPVDEPMTTEGDPTAGDPAGQYPTDGALQNGASSVGAAGTPGEAGSAVRDHEQGRDHPRPPVSPASGQPVESQPLTPAVIGPAVPPSRVPSLTWSDVEMPVHMHDEAELVTPRAVGRPSEETRTTEPVRLTPGEITVEQPLTPADIGSPEQ
ncbi:hypothetical protein [Nesterenkonia suensis]